jgi:regulator of protease activity HflC (stomatin/prohibitin superfamily)
LVKRISLLLLAVVMIALFTGCATRIGPGHVGILVDATGSNRGVLDKPVRTGRVWYNPYSQTVIEFPTFVQTAQWTASVNEGKAVDESVTFTNKDSMVINADISLSYSLQDNLVPHFYVKFHTEDLDKFTHGFLRNVARDCLDNHAGKYAIEQIMGDNAAFLKEARECIQSQVGPFGVNIEQFGLIGAPRPPQPVIAAINAKAQASQLAYQKQNEIVQVQAEAAKQVAEAEGQAKSQITRAKGEAEANRIRTASITEVLLKQKALDNTHDAIWKWDGKMPNVMSGGKENFLMQIPQ